VRPLVLLGDAVALLAQVREGGADALRRHVELVGQLLDGQRLARERLADVGLQRVLGGLLDGLPGVAYLPLLLGGGDALAQALALDVVAHRRGLDAQAAREGGECALLLYPGDDVIVSRVVVDRLAHSCGP
jgi:hypothetical protein